MAGKVRATRSANAGKIQGKDVLAYLNFGTGATEALPQWALFGGQTTADLSMSADEIDANSKDSGGWGESYAGIRSTELSLECIATKADEAYAALKDAFIKSEVVDICRYCTTDSTAERNWYSITEISDTTPHDDMVTFSIKLKGIGAPTFYEKVTKIADVKGAMTGGAVVVSGG